MLVANREGGKVWPKVPEEGGRTNMALRQHSSCITGEDAATADVPACTHALGFSSRSLPSLRGRNEGAYQLL